MEFEVDGVRGRWSSRSMEFEVDGVRPGRRLVGGGGAAGQIDGHLLTEELKRDTL